MNTVDTDFKWLLGEASDDRVNLDTARMALKEILELASRAPITPSTTSPDGASCGTGIMKIRRLAAEALEATE